MWMLLLLIMVQGLATRGATLELEQPIVIMPATADCACNMECPPETRECMKKYNQCLLRLNRETAQHSAMSDGEFNIMMDTVPSDCAVDDVCNDFASAMESLDTCKKDEDLMLAMKADKMGSKRRKRDIASSVHLRPTVKQWPTSTPIKYSINTTFSGTEVALIDAVIAYYTSHSCLRFTKKQPTDTYDGIIFQSANTGCWSSIGVKGGMQTINLQSPSCTQFTIIAHELGHAMGLIHEHTRSDRDAYIDILLNKIEPSQLHNFQTDRYSLNTSPYDYSSMMHYGLSSFPNTAGEKTLMPKDTKYENMIGQRSEPSFLDFYGLNQLYCKDTCKSSSISCKNGGYRNPSDCTKCICPPAFRGVDPECNDLPTFETTKCGPGPQVRPLSGSTSTTTINKGSFMAVSSRSNEFACVWSVTAPSGYAIVVNAASFSLLPTVGDICISQWVELIDPNKPYQVVPRYCSKIGPKNVVVESTRLIIVYMVHKTLAMATTIQGFSLTISLTANECQTANCAADADCFNKPVSGYKCVCRAGYTGDGTTSCTDVIDCAAPSPCGANEVCTDVPGSYTCTCPAAFCGEPGSCRPCANAQFNEDMLNHHNHLRRNANASDMNELEHSQLLSDESYAANAACGSSLAKPSDSSAWISPMSKNNPAATVADFGNLTSVLQVAFDKGCSGTCDVYRHMLLNGYLQVGCAAIVCNSSTPFYQSQLGTDTSKTILVLICSYRPVLNIDDPIFTSGPACTKCTEYRSACRDELCVEAPTTTTPSTTSTTTTPGTTVTTASMTSTTTMLSTTVTTTANTAATTTQPLTTTSTVRPPTTTTTPGKKQELHLVFSIEESVISSSFTNALLKVISQIVQGICTGQPCCKGSQFESIDVRYNGYAIVYRLQELYLFRYRIMAKCTAQSDSLVAADKPINQNLPAVHNSEHNPQAAAAVQEVNLLGLAIKQVELEKDLIRDSLKMCCDNGTSECCGAKLISVEAGDPIQGNVRTALFIVVAIGVLSAIIVLIAVAIGIQTQRDAWRGLTRNTKVHPYDGYLRPDYPVFPSMSRPMIPYKANYSFHAPARSFVKAGPHGHDFSGGSDYLRF